MGRVRDLSEGLWSGQLDPAKHHPFAPLLELERLEEVGVAGSRTGFVSSFANATAFETGEGLVLVVLGAFSIRIYEAMVYVGPLLVAMTLWRVWRGVRGARDPLRGCCRRSCSR